MRNKIIIVFVSIVAGILLGRLVVVPTMTCADNGGLPVLGVGRVVCAQPFNK